MFLYVWLTLFFLLGLCVGSFLNVCIYRLPWEKNLLWPGSHCGQCFQPIRLLDNVPLLSYLLLRGQCRTCGARFSSRYFFIELFTGLAFAGLLYLIAVVNIHDFEALRWEGANLEWGRMPALVTIVTFLHHALLFSFLLVAFFIDLDHREIPFSVTIPGTLVGLLFALFCPWPWPYTPAQAPLPAAAPGWMLPAGGELRTGLYPWPLWMPLPNWLPPDSWQLGLATGLVGILGAALLLRVIRDLFTRGLGMEAMGLGDADLMMMAGAFLGWQPAVLAFFVSTFPGLVFGIGYLSVQAFLVRRKLQLVLQLAPETRQPLFVLEGETVALVELPAALTETAAKLRKKGLYVDFTALYVLADEWESVIHTAAREAGIRRLRRAHERAQTDMVMYVVHLLFGKLLALLRPRVTAELTVAVRYDAGKVGFQINDQPVAANQLAAQLRRLAKQPAQTTLLVDTSGLDQWLNGLLEQVQETARKADIGTVQIGEKGFPFGPALAVGIVLTMLAWKGLGQRMQPVFFDGTLLLTVAVLGSVLLYGMSYGLRILKR